MDLDQIIISTIYISRGILVTLQYTLISFIGGLVLGSMLSILKYCKIGERIIDGYVSVIRGTPLLLQLSFFYFILPSLIQVNTGIFVTGVVAFTVNASAYIAEILKGGLNSIDKGQFEAAKALEIPLYLTYKDIIMPQVIKSVLPALINEFIALLKETALISTLGEADIMRRSQLVAAEYYRYFEPLCIAALCYYLMVLMLEFLGKFVERKLN